MCYSSFKGAVSKQNMLSWGVGILYGLCTITVMCAGVKSRGHVAMDYDIQVFT